MATTSQTKQGTDFIFHELTRSICPECKAVIDAQVIIRDNKVYMRKRCPEHGWFEGIISSDAEMYVGSVRFNKPGTIPLDFSTEVENGCPLDCGLCPEHKQHICLALIEVNTACNLDCPICFADAGIGYSLTLEQVESMLDRFVEIEGDPEVVQFSGGEPTIHPRLPEMIQAAKDRGIRQVMINTNGVRLAHDDKFLSQMAALDPVVYFQFDGLREETYRTIRGEPLLDTKMRALDRLAEAGMTAVLVAAIERDVNTDEVGPILEFGLKHP
ncbi:MAG: radical SAM protein, partial [Chloroflexi bacterium]|nr:radical SAM protein [Chloroflexota bacterium]